jgi:hypothetical protein
LLKDAKLFTHIIPDIHLPRFTPKITHRRGVTAPPLPWYAASIEQQKECKVICVKAVNALIDEGLMNEERTGAAFTALSVSRFLI